MKCLNLHNRNLKNVYSKYIMQLSSGNYPSRWSESFLVPIFKSEKPKLPQNYRGIAVANCFGRIFNSILNTRLDKFLAENNVN